MKEITRIFDIVTQYEERHPEQKVALSIKRNGKWADVSPLDYLNTTNDISYAMIKLGIEPGDKVGIVASNSPEWNMLDMAIMQIGAISVPVYPTISASDYQYILHHSDMKMVFLEGAEVMKKVTSILPECPNVKYVYTFVNRELYPYLEQLIALGRENPDTVELAKRRDAVLPEQCATIVYTSGSTGLPKGVMLSHKNIVSQIVNLRPIPAKWSKRALSFLPICHVYERVLTFLYQDLGMTVYYVQSLGTIAENLKEVNPTMMTAVPRVLEKFYDKIWNSSKQMKPMKKKFFRWAIRLAKQYKIAKEDRSLWYEMRHFIADKLVYSKIRKGIGGDFDIVVSGAASLQPPLAAFFSAIGMPIYEGYGATETSPVIATSSRGRYGRAVGSVGPLLPGVEVKIAENNEIYCRGHNVMMGYYKEPELTKSVIDEEGWFHTGDMGYIDEHGLLFITGRLKNLFKTSLGKYINPQMIEERFSASPFIGNIVVVGENQKFAAALIVPDFEFLQSWCRGHGVAEKDVQGMLQNEVVLKRFAREVATYNATLGDTEQVKKYKLISDVWSQENGILTPTLKVKRYVVLERYAEMIEQLFQ